MKRYPKVIIQHGDLSTKDLAELARVIADQLKKSFSEFHVIHRNISGNEITIEVKAANIKADV